MPSDVIVRAEVERGVVVNDAEAHILQPALTTEQVARQVVGRGEV
jgi:hypothetical protein